VDIDGYAIVYAALLMFFGRLAERPSRSELPAWRRTFHRRIGPMRHGQQCRDGWSSFRLAQAAGAALMTPTSLGLCLRCFRPSVAAAREDLTAIGAWAQLLARSLAVVLVTLDWRLIFLVNVPIGLAALLVVVEAPAGFLDHEAPRPSAWDAALVYRRHWRAGIRYREGETTGDGAH